MCATCGSSELQRSRYQEAVAAASSSSTTAASTHHLTRYVARRPSPPPSRPLVLKELSYSFPAPCPPPPPPKPTVQYYLCQQCNPISPPRAPAVYVQEPRAPRSRSTVNVNHEFSYKFEH